MAGGIVTCAAGKRRFPLSSRPLIAYLRKFYYYDPEEEISAALPDGKEAREPSGQPGVRSQT